MTLYSEIFKQVLVKEEGPVPTAAPMAPAQPPTPSDSDSWNASNSNIVDNPDLSKQFDVEPLPANLDQEYREKIGNWITKIDELEKLFKEDMLKFASAKAQLGGPAAEIYNKTIKAVTQSLETLGHLKGTLSYLPDVITVAMARDDKKQRGLK